MIIDNVMYNNIDSVTKTNQGIRLHRFSKEVIEKINPHARYMASYACNAEIRFVTDAPTCFVSLLAEEGSAKIIIYYGDYVIHEKILEPGKITKISLSVPEPVSGLGEDFYKNNKFKMGVWRLHCHNAILTLCDIDTMGYSIRPPKKEEMPERTMISYGSSISHGAGAVYNPVSYVNTTANLLDVDCLAKGVGGSCFAESVIADDFAARTDWDFALLEMGVNMAGSVEPAEFKERFCYFADTLYATGKKLVFLTIFPHVAHWGKQGKEKEYENILAYCEIIRNKCAEFDKEKVLVVEGSDILTTSEMLTADGIHPCTEGHIKMGYNLYEKIKEFVG